ncbi:glycosyltransferase family 4 protein [Candidatus Omnitrophota bacterium]
MSNLLFCMTPGVGLKDWQENGSLERELKPLVGYARRGWKVKILTFDRGELPVLPKGIEAVRFPSRRFLWFLPWACRELGSWADVIRTNQSVHVYFYTTAARFWKKPILIRCGYVHGESLETDNGLIPKVRLYQWLEGRAFRKATHCQVPTEELAEWITKRYKVPGEKVSVVPNFVDTATFKPVEGISKMERSVISVGRLDPVKRFDRLIRACAEIPGCRLTIIGEGPQRECLKGLAEQLGLALDLPGNVLNEKLPELLSRHEIFAITSKREGNPKALIEAMACNMATIGVDAPGVRNVIKDGWNGLLCASDPRGLSDAIIRLFEDFALRKEIGENAGTFIRSKYDQDIVFSAEMQTIENILNYRS